jgi:hypothetical protein
LNQAQLEKQERRQKRDPPRHESVAHEAKEPVGAFRFGRKYPAQPDAQSHQSDEGNEQARHLLSEISTGLKTSPFMHHS